jgi:hypothetical protein
MSAPPIIFLLPETDDVFAKLPRSIDEYWQWQGEAASISPYWGVYHWVLQTYLYLKSAGLRVELHNRMPDRGVIVTHMDCLDYGFRPSAQQYLVVMLVDRDVPHPRAALHVVHNPVQRLQMGLPSRYMPPWPQVGLLARDAAHGDRFEVVGYFGYPHNLDPSLNDARFLDRLAGLGLRMHVPPAAEWHDFRHVDCVLAVRNLGRVQRHLNKPVLKLLNAWLAGVPAVLGHEAAFVEQGSPGRGYLEACSPDEVIASLTALRDDLALRKALVAHGRAAAATYEPPATIERWRRLLLEKVIPAAEARFRRRGDGIASRALMAVRERVLWRTPGRFG